MFLNKDEIADINANIICKFVLDGMKEGKWGVEVGEESGTEDASLMQEDFISLQDDLYEDSTKILDNDFCII